MSQPTENPQALSEQLAWQRTQLINRLIDEGRADMARALQQCGQDITLLCRCCGAKRTGHTQCKRRWCPVCQRSISARRMARFKDAAASMRWPLSIMLSHTNEDSAEDVFRTLMPAFKRFRRTELWKKNVKGGIVSYEVTNRFGTWHDHLHVLCDCRWLALQTPEPRKTDTKSQLRRKLKDAKHELSTAWAGCLGQETAVTWVDRADMGRLIEHIKYTVKADDLRKCTQPIGPLLKALHGRRLVQPFGSLYGLSKKWAEEDDARKAAVECDGCGARASMIPEMVVEQRRRQKERRKERNARDEMAWAVTKNRAWERAYKEHLTAAERRRYEAIMETARANARDWNNAEDVPW